MTEKHQDCYYIEGVLAKNSSVIHEIYKNYFLLASKIAGNPEDAEDLFQDALIDVYRKAKNTGGCFLTTASLRTYLYVLIRNKWVDKLRKNKRISNIGVINDEDLRLMSIDLGEVESVEKEMIRLERKNLVRGSLEILGEPCKELLILYGNDYKHKEIAEKFSFTTNEVGVHIQRCLKKLKQLCGDCLTIV